VHPETHTLVAITIWVATKQIHLLKKWHAFISWGVPEFNNKANPKLLNQFFTGIIILLHKPATKFIQQHSGHTFLCIH
jgi:hypothetical protein